MGNFPLRIWVCPGSQACRHRCRPLSHFTQPFQRRRLLRFMPKLFASRPALDWPMILVWSKHQDGSAEALFAIYSIRLCANQLARAGRMSSVTPSRKCCLSRPIWLRPMSMGCPSKPATGVRRCPLQSRMCRWQPLTPGIQSGEGRSGQRSD